MVNLNPMTQVARTSFDEVWFETVFLALDRLHDAVSEQSPANISTIAPAEMVGWLEDIIYTAQEAIVEIREKTPDQTMTEAEYAG